MNVLPSTSVIVAPRASAATTGNVSASGEATLVASRSSTSRERGPGTSVFSSIVRVVAIASSLAEGVAWLNGYESPTQICNNPVKRVTLPRMRVTLGDCEPGAERQGRGLPGDPERGHLGREHPRLPPRAPPDRPGDRRRPPRAREPHLRPLRPPLRDEPRPERLHPGHLLADGRRDL